MPFRTFYFLLLIHISPSYTLFLSLALYFTLSIFIYLPCLLAFLHLHLSLFSISLFLSLALILSFQFFSFTISFYISLFFSPFLSFTPSIPVTRPLPLFVCECGCEYCLTCFLCPDLHGPPAVRTDAELIDCGDTESVGLVSAQSLHDSALVNTVCSGGPTLITCKQTHTKHATDHATIDDVMPKHVSAD